MRLTYQILGIFLFSFCLTSLPLASARAESRWTAEDVAEKNAHLRAYLVSSVESYISDYFRANRGTPEEVSLIYKRLPNQGLIDGVFTQPETFIIEASKFTLQTNFNVSYSHKPGNENNKMAGWEINPNLRLAVELSQRFSIGLNVVSSHSVQLDERGNYNNLIGNSNFVGVLYVTANLNRLVRSFAAGSQVAFLIGTEGDFRNEQTVGSNKNGYSAGLVLGTNLVINFKPLEKLTVSPGVIFNYRTTSLFTSDDLAIKQHWLTAGPKVSFTYQQKINRSLQIAGAATIAVSNRNNLASNIASYSFKESLYLFFEPSFEVEYLRMFNFSLGARVSYGPGKWLRYGMNFSAVATF